MIQYANRGVKAYIALLVCMHGSVVPHALPPAILSTTISLALGLTQNDGAAVPDLLYSKETFAIQIYAIVLGFLIVTRTNMAIDRYTSAMQGVQVMVSKWLDGYMHLCAFVNAHVQQGDRKEELMRWRENLAHWFSLMATFAVAGLRGDEENTEFHESPHSIFGASARHRLAAAASTPRGSTSGSSAPRHSAVSLKPLSDVAFKFENPRNEPESPRASNKVEHFCFKTVSMVGRSDKTSWPQDDSWTDQIHRSRLEYLGSCSAYEKRTLSEVRDKVLVVSSWICETITRAVLRHEQDDGTMGPVLRVPPPIVSRVFQELSSGMQAYHQALMVVIVPFPFPFAQVLTYLLLGWTILAPFMVLQFTRSLIFSPVLTFLGVFGFFGIDMIAKEIENPFGDDANDLPLLSMHKDFNNSLTELLMPNPHLVEMGLGDVPPDLLSC